MVIPVDVIPEAGIKGKQTLQEKKSSFMFLLYHIYRYRYKYMHNRKKAMLFVVRQEEKDL